jgi:hypothetical protein
MDKAITATLHLTFYSYIKMYILSPQNLDS